MLLSAAMPSIAQLILSFGIPESPRYHIKKGNLSGARHTLSRVYPTLTSSEVEHKIERIQAVLQLESESIVRLKLGSQNQLGQLWHDIPTRRALIVACGLQFFQQVCLCFRPVETR